MLIHKQGHKSRVTSVRPTCLSIGRAPVASLASPPWPSPSQCTSECTCVLSRVGWGFSCPALCRVATLRAQSPRARHLRGRIQPISLSITTLYRESDGARGQRQPSQFNFKLSQSHDTACCAKLNSKLITVNYITNEKRQNT